MVSQTYCPYLWMHLHVGTDGDVRTCCSGEDVLGNINSNTLEDIWNNETMKNMRLQLLNNEKPNNCNHCWNLEDKWGLPSARTQVLHQWAKYVDPLVDTDSSGFVKDMKLRYFDIRFNNLCNFKCRTCDPRDSSSIANELVKFTNMKKTSILNDQGTILYEEVKQQYDHVKRIYFAGGEPSMQKEHYQVLRDLNALGKASDIELLYSTNGSKLQTNFGNLIELWKPFKEVLISYSFDGYGKAAEYWRSGTIWSTIESNVKKLHGIPNIKIGLHSTIAWPNVFNWLEFIKYCFDTDLIDVVNRTGLEPLNGPACFSLSAVPDFKKTQIVSEVLKLKTYIQEQHKLKYGDEGQIDGYSGILFEGLDKIVAKTMEQGPPINKYEWKLRVTQIDGWRNEDFFNAFPEHEDMRPYVI